MTEKRSDLVRSVTTFVRDYVNDRRRVLRRGARFEARLPFIISLIPSDENSAESPSNAPALVGHTRDLSETGMTLLLPSVRIGGAYLTDRDNYLGIQLELPSGPVALLAVPARFEQLSQKEDGFSYLLGVRIIKREDGERDRYAAYLVTLESQQRQTPERRQTQTATALAGPNSMTQMGAWENLTPAAVGNAFEKFIREKTRSRKP